MLLAIFFDDDEEVFPDNIQIDYAAAGNAQDAMFSAIEWSGHLHTIYAFIRLFGLQATRSLIQLQK